MPSMVPWKEEPVSPLNSEVTRFCCRHLTFFNLGFFFGRFQEVSLLDDPFFQTAFDDVKFEHDVFEDCETKAEVASQILEHLENLVDLDELIKSGKLHQINVATVANADTKACF